MTDKPLVFNYREYDTLRDKCNDMAVEIEDLREQIKALKAENTNLKIHLRILEANEDDKSNR